MLRFGRACKTFSYRMLQQILISVKKVAPLGPNKQQIYHMVHGQSVSCADNWSTVYPTNDDFVKHPVYN